jgi:hypothetical protein
MKFKALVILCFFVLGIFALLVIYSDYADAQLSQRPRRMDWRKIDGLNWTQDHEDGVKLKFHEMKILLEEHHNIKRNDKSKKRMAYMLFRQGTIIRDGDRFIIGEDNIEDFFKRRGDQTLTIGQMEILDVGFVNRMVEGHMVDHYVKLKYNIKLETKEGDKVLKNDDFIGTMILMHRHNCPWDG